MKQKRDILHYTTAVSDQTCITLARMNIPNYTVHNKRCFTADVLIAVAVLTHVLLLC
jgi:hypothetical protein